MGGPLKMARQWGVSWWPCNQKGHWPNAPLGAGRLGGWWVLFQTQAQGRVREAGELFLAQSFLFKEASHQLMSHWPTGDHMATHHCTPITLEGENGFWPANSSLCHSLKPLDL